MVDVEDTTIKTEESGKAIKLTNTEANELYTELTNLDLTNKTHLTAIKTALTPPE